MSTLGLGGESLALTILAMMEVPNFFSKHLPSELTIYKFAHDAGDVAALRRGEKKAAVQAILLGLAISYITRSIVPLIGVAIMTSYQVWDTEQCIRKAGANPNTQSMNSPENLSDSQASNGPKKEASFLKTSAADAGVFAEYGAALL